MLKALHDNEVSELCNKANINENTGKTQVLYGINNVINAELQFFSKTTGKIDTCMNYTSRH